MIYTIAMRVLDWAERNRRDAETCANCLRLRGARHFSWRLFWRGLWTLPTTLAVTAALAAAYVLVYFFYTDKE
jgi:hypothetical protein